MYRRGIKRALDFILSLCGIVVLSPVLAVIVLWVKLDSPGPVFFRQKLSLIHISQIDKVIYNYIVSQGAKPNFKGYGGFPGSACISVNDTVIPVSYTHLV